MIIITAGLFHKKFAAMAIFPFIFIGKKTYKFNQSLINHEKIHLRQQVEMGVLPFYLWYGIEFIIHWVRIGNADAAYHQISFEKEAYGNELDLNYLRGRSFWHFLKYL